jgi:hypothetical protein
MRRAFLVVVAIVTMSSLAFAQQTTPAQQRVAAAERIVNVLSAQYASGMATFDDLASWNKRLFEAKRDAGATGAALVAAAQAWVDKMKALETLAQNRVHTGIATSVEVDKALFCRLEAEIALAKVRAGTPASTSTSTSTSPGY